MADPSGVQQLKRLGYKIPRKVLLPPYLTADYFQQYGDIIDAVYKTEVDQKVAIIRELRSGWHENPDVEALILNGSLIDNSAWDTLERSLVTQQDNSLGMYLSSAGSITTESLTTISRFLGFYWWERGTYGFLEFINFCLGTGLTMTNLWAEYNPADPNNTEYLNFTPENDDGTPPGTPIWEGGTWFPTTHVTLTARGGLSLEATDLVTFFYEIANYNLVVNAIDYNFDIPVEAFPGDGMTQIVALGVNIQATAYAEFYRPVSEAIQP